MVMNIENFTKPLYLLPESTFCILLHFFFFLSFVLMKVILLVYTLGLYISERKDRVMVLNIENLTKPLYQLLESTFI